MARKNQERNMKILNMLQTGRTMQCTADALGVSFHIVNAVRRSVSASKAVGLRHRTRNDELSRRLPWTPADELLDDDEQYGPFRRCRCDAVLMRSNEIECGQCLSTDYVFAVLDGHRDDNRAIDPYMTSDAEPMSGKAGKDFTTKGASSSRVTFIG